MFYIPWEIISALTFPWVIVHEWAHKKYCEWTWVKVIEVVYFRFWNPSWYVFHEEPNDYSKVFWISVWPLIINTLFALVLSFIASQTVVDSWIYNTLLWIALSIGLHAFPSDQDVSHILSKSKLALKKWRNYLDLLTFPFVGIIFLANKLRFFWFDLIYALLLIQLWSWWLLFSF